MGRHESRGLEDENKNNETLEDLKRMVKVLTGSTRKGPPPRNTAVAPVKPIAQSREAGDNRPAHLKGKPLPYVEIALIRTPLRIREEIGKESSKNQAAPAYKSQAPVEAGIDFEKIVEDLLDREIVIPLRTLAGASSAIQKEIKKHMTKARLPVEAGPRVHFQDNEEIIPAAKIDVATVPFASYAVMTDVSDELPEGHLIAHDPVLQYLAENKEALPSDLIVAKSTEPLRAIYAVINRIAQEECLLDGGSQIVSMSKEVAVGLGLTWDPSIRVNMESSTSHVEKTLGLARNVCFRTGGLDLYLQVHILENPPYKVLLGRPFETFTKCVATNKEDGSSELELTDPNTMKVASIPTYARGVGPREMQEQRYQGF